MRTSNPRSYNRAAAIAGLVFVGLGIVFLLEALNVFELRARYVWPVVLIAIGVQPMESATIISMSMFGSWAFWPM